MADSDIEVRMFEETQLQSWVMSKCDKWRQSYKDNYEDNFEHYYRIWRGIFKSGDETRSSERSKIISPATAQAIESSVAEIEEASFGRGNFFDIKDDIVFDEPPPDMTEEQTAAFQQLQAQKAQDKQRIEFLKNKLGEDFQKNMIRKDMGEVLLNAALFGTGIAEIVLDLETEIVPETRAMAGMSAKGVAEREKAVVKLKPVLPQNFLIQPEATSVENSLGVAIDEDVSPHSIQLLQEKGIYDDVTIESGTRTDSDLEVDPTLVEQPDDVVRLTKYYGLVPRHMLAEYEGATAFAVDVEESIAQVEGEEVETVEVEVSEPTPTPGTVGESYYVEACVVIANGTTILNAIENPYMMGDRPILAFSWDAVPSKFWGRGIAEKAFNIQSALDSELRGRADAMALTNVPMIAMDATRKPRGEDGQVRPGKMLLTNGNPSEVLQPFNFGQVNQITFAQSQALQNMISQATGAFDSAGMPDSINRTSSSTLSMGLSSIIKRQKRTLVNFQENFLLPFVKAAACRYMQFDSDNYPVQDFLFTVSGSLGILQREYETGQLVQLLQTMPQDNPLYMVIIQSVIENMSLANREQLNATIEQAMRPDPQAQQVAQAQAQNQFEFVQAQTAALIGQATESQARAEKTKAETIAVPIKLESERIGKIADITKADNDLDANDKLKLDVAKTAIEERRMDLEEARFNRSAE